MPRRPQPRPKKTAREKKELFSTKPIRKRGPKRIRPAPPPPAQRLAPTPPRPRFKKKPRWKPIIKPRIKPKKRVQLAGLLRKGGTVKRKIPRRRYKKGGVAKKHLRC